MAKIITIEREGNKIGYCFWCPACDKMHKFCTSDAHDEGWPIWGLSGTLDSPTVSGSIGFSKKEGEYCHSFIENGKITYAGDSTHHLKDQTVDLPEL